MEQAGGPVWPLGEKNKTSNTCSQILFYSEQLGTAVASLLTCQPEQRGLAETVCAPVSDQGETGRRGMQEVARLGLGLQ